jgi:hypothetical protein
MRLVRWISELLQRIFPTEPEPDLTMNNGQHYLLLWAIRESTGSLVRRRVVFTGDKHYGMSNAWLEFQEELGTGWLVGGSITTRQHFEMLVELQTMEDERWNALLR